MKRSLPLKAEVLLNQLQIEGMVERQRAVFELDDDCPRQPSVDPTLNPQSRRLAVEVDRHE